MIALADVGVSVLDCVHATPKAVSEGFPYIAIPNIQDGRIRLEGVRRISPADLDKWTMKTTPQAGDILVTRRGRVGDTAPIPNGLRCAIGQNLVLLRSDGKEVDQAYLKWATRGPLWMAEVDRLRNVGAVFDSLNVRDIARLRIPVPPLDKQRRIAEVLGAIDDLIDTNERLGLRLTEAASAFGQRLLLEINSGEPRSVEDIATIAKGYSYKSAELVEGDGWLVGLKNVGRQGVFRPDGFKPLSARVKPAHVVENGDLVVAQTDLTQAREVIGRPVRVRRGGREGVLVASLDLAIVRPLEGVPGQFIQSVLESIEFRDHVLGFCNGTTVLHMGARAIPSFPVVLPDADHLSRFEALEPLRDSADEAFETAESLRRIRDELLPLLISGAVRVRPEGVAA